MHKPVDLADIDRAGIEPVQRSGTGTLIIRHRPAVEVAFRAVASLVYPQAGVSPQPVQEREGPVGVLQSEGL